MESHKDLPPLPCSHGPNRSTHARAEAAGERRRAPAVRASEIPASLATQVSKQGAQACPPSPLCSAREQPAPAWTVTEAGTGLCRSPQAPAGGPGGSAAPRGRGRAPLSPAARACGSPAPAPAPLPARPAAATPRVSCLQTSRSPYHALWAGALWQTQGCINSRYSSSSWHGLHSHPQSRRQPPSAAGPSTCAPQHQRPVSCVRNGALAPPCGLCNRERS